jgi:hypothetical protein
MPAFPHGGGGRKSRGLPARAPPWPPGGSRGDRGRARLPPGGSRGGQARPHLALAAAACRSVFTFPAAASHWNYCSSIPV